jgi:uncharacterized protein YuzE
MEVSYDEEADVLYLKLKDCENPDTIHREDDILVTVDRKTDEVVGYTVIGFEERNDEIKLPEKVKIPA